MKLKSKLISSGLVTAVTCALVGSITGTFAWYGYSTRATAVVGGKVTSKAANLQLGLVSDYVYEDNPNYNSQLPISDSNQPLRIVEVDNPEYASDPTQPAKIKVTQEIEGLEKADENLICWSPIGGGLKMASIKSYLDTFGYAQGEMAPATSGWTKKLIDNPDFDDQAPISEQNPAKIEVDADFAPRKMPIYQHNEQELAEKSGYFYLPIVARVSDLQGGFLSNTKIYLSDADITLNNDSSSLNKAFRLGFKTYNDDVKEANYTIFNPSSEVDGQTPLGGLLDLNKDGYIDVDQVDYEYKVRDELLYGAIKSSSYYEEPVMIDNPNYVPGGQEPEKIPDPEKELKPNPAYGITSDEEFIEVDKTQKTVFKNNEKVPSTWKDEDFEQHIHDPLYHEENVHEVKEFEAYQQSWKGTNSLIAEFDSSYYLVDRNDARYIVTTGENTIAHIDLTMWIEGWDKNVNNTTLGVEFFLGLQFQIDRVD